MGLVISLHRICLFSFSRVSPAGCGTFILVIKLEIESSMDKTIGVKRESSCILGKGGYP